MTDDEPTQAAIPKLPLEKLSGRTGSDVRPAAAEQDAAPVGKKRHASEHPQATPVVPVVPPSDSNPAPDLPETPLLWNSSGERPGTSSTQRMDVALQNLHSDIIRGASPPPSAPPPLPIFGRMDRRLLTTEAGSQIWQPASPPSTAPLYIADLHPRRSLPPLYHPSMYQQWSPPTPAKQNSTTWIGGPWDSQPILATHGGHHRPTEDPPPPPPHAAAPQRQRPPSPLGPSVKGDREMMHAVLSGKLYKSSLALGVEGAKMRQWGERRVMEMAKRNPKEVLAAIRMHSERPQ